MRGWFCNRGVEIRGRELAADFGRVLDLSNEGRGSLRSSVSWSMRICWTTGCLNFLLVAKAMSCLGLQAASASRVVQSLQKISLGSKFDWTALESFLQEKMPLSYKNWSDTFGWSEELERIIGDPEREDFRFTFDRVLTGGNWWDAADYAATTKTDGSRPWIVLVSGLNGIRKTTALTQPWFEDVLREALGDQLTEEDSALPVGGNSFFRQLDYLVATIANEDLKELYASDVTMTEYSSQKDEIFKRHRTFAEILGVLLLRSSIKRRMNALVETSGRDVASFDFIDALFSDEVASTYCKLVVHFTIDDLAHAERSVDTRMALEKRTGSEIIVESAGAQRDPIAVARAVVGVNAGGPYGSEVLKSVKADSDRVMAGVLGKDGGRKGWLKASILIKGSEDPAAWTARAVKQDGTESPNCFVFRR